MTNYTNYLETITNGTNIYRVYEVITNFTAQTNFVTETNFITKTNTVTSLSDPALWVTIVASILTLAGTIIMLISVSEMRKQSRQSHNNSVIMTLIQYDQQLISATDDLIRCLIEISNNNKKDKNSKLGVSSKLYNILAHLVTIYYSKLYENNDYLKSFFNELINPSIANIIGYFICYYDETYKESEFKISDALLIKYCKEQKIKIPDEILIK